MKRLALAAALLAFAAPAFTQDHNNGIAFDPSIGATGYNIYRGTYPSGEASTPINTEQLPPCGIQPMYPEQCIFDDITAVPGTRYFYIIKAFNGTVLSNPSQEISTIVKPAGAVDPPGNPYFQISN
jgi:hypothetical protein